MVLLDYQKKRTVFLIALAFSGLSLMNIFGIRELTSKIVDYSLISGIHVGTVIGIFVIYIVYNLYKNRGWW